jgi:putative copper export protein/mono/diheme cytochrome c family protein
MDLVAVLVRLIHLASAVLLFGILAFAWLVGGPALRPDRAATSTRADALGRQWRRGARWTLLATVGSALLDLWRQSTVVTAQGWGASLTVPIVTAVLTQTRYGTIWLVRQALLGGVAVALGRRRWRRDGSDRRQGAAAVLAGASLAALAAAGHAASAPSWPPLAIAVDAAHLIATGAWLGGLLPFARLLLWAGAGRDREGLEVAAIATRRFSGLGLVAMTTLASTGVFNLWEHVPSIPALMGTAYGHWLSLKLGVWLLLLGTAAGSRWRVKPRLLALTTTGDVEAGPTVVHRLRRQLLGELTLGSAILATVAVLGLTPPAHHVAPNWPLPFRLAWAATPELPGVPPRLAVATGAAVLGLLVAVVAGVMRPRHWGWMAGAGLVAVAAAVVLELPIVAVSAYPTTYLQSAIPYTAAAIAHGQGLYETHCAACHDGAGVGNASPARGHSLLADVGPAQSGPGPTMGDLFWLVTHGEPGSTMPAFGDRLAPRDRWAILQYLAARTEAERARTLGPDLAPRALAIAAPDFDYTTRRGESGALHEHRGHHSVLLVLFSVPGSLDRLVLLDRVAATLRDAGLQLLAVPLHPDPALARQPVLAALTLPIIDDGAAEVVATYRLFEGPPAPSTTTAAPELAHMELLIDPQGALRARWVPDDDREGWANPARLQAETLRLSEETPEAPPPKEHVH